MCLHQGPYSFWSCIKLDYFSLAYPVVNVTSSSQPLISVQLTSSRPLLQVSIVRNDIYLLNGFRSSQRTQRNFLRWIGLKAFATVTLGEVGFDTFIVHLADSRVALPAAPSCERACD